MQDDLIYTAEQIGNSNQFLQTKKFHSFFNPSEQFVSSVGLLDSDPNLEISRNKNMNSWILFSINSKF